MIMGAERDNVQLDAPETKTNSAEEKIFQIQRERVQLLKMAITTTRRPAQGVLYIREFLPNCSKLKTVRQDW